MGDKIVQKIVMEINESCNPPVLKIPSNEVTIFY